MRIIPDPCPDPDPDPTITLTCTLPYQVGKLTSAFQRVSVGSPTGPDGLPGDPAAQAERLALQAMRYAEARALLSSPLDTLHGTPSLVCMGFCACERMCVQVSACVFMLLMCSCDDYADVPQRNAGGKGDRARCSRGRAAGRATGRSHTRRKAGRRNRAELEEAHQQQLGFGITAARSIVSL